MFATMIEPSTPPPSPLRDVHCKLQALIDSHSRTVNVTDLRPPCKTIAELVQKEGQERSIVKAFLTASKARLLFDEAETLNRNTGSGFIDVRAVARMLRHHIEVEDRMNLLKVVPDSWHALTKEVAQAILEGIEMEAKDAL